MNRLRKILSILLALTVLTASVGITVNAHVCGGQVQSTAFFVKAKPCGMMQLLAHSKHSSKNKSKCCDEQTKVIKTTEDNAEAGSVLVVLTGAAVLVPRIAYTPSTLPAANFRPGQPKGKPPLYPREIILATHSLLI